MDFVTYPSLKGAGVIVSGGGSGIGADIVRAFSANGAQVAILDINIEAGAALAEELNRKAGKVTFYPCDVTDTEALRKAIDLAAAEIGPVKVLVNNAAYDQRQTFADVDEADLDRMLAINFRHVFFASQKVVSFMKDTGGGSIVNITSTGWMRGTMRTQAYAAGKAAIVGFTNSLAREVGQFGIRVNAVAPGWVMTDRQKARWEGDPAVTAEIDRTCLKTLPTGPDVAALVLLLGSDQGKAITKQTMIVDCGSLG